MNNSNGSHEDYCLHGNLELKASKLRVNYWYLNIYVIWLNTILNILVPIISLIVLNVLISRYVQR